MDTRFQLVLLPGLGADRRQFHPQKSTQWHLEVPEWIEPGSHERLPDYARRLSKTITPRRPLVLGGSSFGGMVAYEMAAHLAADAVVLIGSCRSQRAIRRLTPALFSMTYVVPEVGVRWARALAPLGFRVMCHLARQDRNFSQRDKDLCVDMFRQACPRFVKWACSALLHWLPGPLHDTPTFHIHGRRDLVIPAHSVAADEIIPTGGHLINMTHAEAVNRFIARAFRTVTVEPDQ